jgi:hypothetical protein
MYINRTGTNSTLYFCFFGLNRTKGAQLVHVIIDSGNLNETRKLDFQHKKNQNSKLIIKFMVPTSMKEELEKMRKICSYLPI